MRYSLKTLLYATIVLALGIALWATYRRVRPLREELLRAKAEIRDAQEMIANLQSKLGQFPDVDPKRIQAMRVGNPLADLRRLRVYLPADQKYYLHVASGHIPVHEVNLERWRETPGVDFGVTTSSAPSGEFTIDIQPLVVDGEWKLRITELADLRGHTLLDLDRFSGWIGDRRTWYVDSVGEEVLRQEEDEPLILYRLHRGILKESDGGFSRASPQGTADGVVVWIDQNEP